MRRILASALPFQTEKGIAFIGRPNGSPDQDSILISTGRELGERIAGAPKRLSIDLAGEIDLSKVYCGYYRLEDIIPPVSMKEMSTGPEHRNQRVNTLIILADISHNIEPLDVRRAEVAIIIVGEKAQTFFGKLELAKLEVKRPLDLTCGRAFAGRRLREFGLSRKENKSFDVVSQQPRLEPVNQMMAEVPARLPGSDYSI